MLESPIDRNMSDYIPAKEVAYAKITGKIVMHCGTKAE